MGGADQQKAPLLVLPRDLGEEVGSDVFRDEVPQRAVVRQAIARERADVATFWTFRRVDLDDDGRVSEQELVDALPVPTTCASASGSSEAIGAALPMAGLRHLLATILLLASGVTLATEEPRYTVVRTEDAFEVRHYEAYLVAETLVAGSADEAGSQGFRVLAGYIFGENKGAREIAMTAPVAQTPTRIAMTAPVAQSPGAVGYVVQFAMPPEWTLDTLPEPTDPAVRLRAVPARTVAVIRYSGTWSQERYAEHLAKLQDALAGAGLKWRGEPVWARYDPPWKPWFLRRNEIWLELD